MNGNGANGAHGAAHLGDEPLILTRDQVQQREVFPLTHTGGQALVRMLPLADLVARVSLSPAQYPIVMRIFGEVKPEPAEVPKSGAEAALEDTRRNRLLIDAICELGFIKPRLVGTQAEADAIGDPWVWCVDEVDPRDLQRYFDLVTSSEVEAAKVIEPFLAQRVESEAVDESGPPPPPPEPPVESQYGDDLLPVGVPEL